MKRLLIILLLIPLVCSGQRLIKNYTPKITQNSYICNLSYIKETRDYNRRVRVDTGYVVDLNYVDAIYERLKIIHIKDSGIIGFSAKAGMKVVNGRVKKRYNLFDRANDEIAATANQFGYYGGSYCKFNNIYPLTSIRPYVTGVVLPTYIDLFITGYYTSAFSVSQDLYNSQGCLFFTGSNSNAWLITRGGTYNLAPGVANWGVNSLLTGRFIYNNINRKYYANAVEQSNGTLSGTLKANSNYTYQLNLFYYNSTAYGGGLHKDLFIFSQLPKAKSDIFESFLIATNKATIVNILVDGDSQFTSYAGATYNSAIVLDSSLSALNITPIITNVAVAGQTSTQLLANFQTHLNSYYNSSIAKNYCLIWVGVNDIASDSTLRATAFENILTAVAASNAKGFKTFVCTQRMWSSVYGTAKTWTLTQEFRRSILDSAATRNYIVVDIANDSHWNSSSAPSNTLYYISADQTHPTNTAHSIIGRLISSIILANY